LPSRAADLARRIRRTWSTLGNCVVEVAKPLPDFREGQAGEFLVRRVMPTCRIDGTK
jgi:hypothetical protein